MARTIQQIQDEIIAQKEATPELSELTSDSKVAVWRLITYIIAFAIWTQEKLWDVFKAETEDYVARSRVHAIRWYRDRVLEFRDGKDLNWTDGTFQYPELDTGESLDDLQIVKQAAVVEAPGELLIKIATQQGSQLQPVSAQQQTRVTAYMNEIKDAGNHIRVVNLPPDELIIEGIIYCDPLLIDLSDGSLVTDSSIKPVEQAAESYINEENQSNFNGEFRRTRFVDTLQQAEGVQDPVITSIKARYGTLPFEEVDIRYLPNSGYHTITGMTFQYIALNG